MRSEKMTVEFRALECAIFPDRKSKRVHVEELRDAWALYLKTLEKKSWLKKLWERLLTGW